MSIDDEFNNMNDHDLLIRLNVNIDTIKGQTENFDKRINKLENWRSYTTGGIAVLTFIIGFIYTKI